MSKKFKGTFTGRVQTDWLAHEARKMMLLETFSFIDSEGVQWTAVKGSVVDGASIPKFFQYVIGSPFVGHYRRASVIHDVFCATKKRSHKRVHRMFYEAMLADGVSKFKAKIMYLAVKTGGPKWRTK